MSDAWNAFVTDCRDRYGVATVDHARTHGIPASTFYRRTTSERWREPYAGVRIAPWVRPSAHTDLSALLHAGGDRASATGETAAWLYGLRGTPKHLEIAVPHGQRVPVGAEGRVHRHRWLREQDQVLVQGLAALRIPAMAVTLANGSPLDVRARVIDAIHRDLASLSDIIGRLGEVGPVPGRRQLARLLHELADRDVESIFHDLVLDELVRRDYRPALSPLFVQTPDGRGVHPDIPLPVWRIAIEVQGDRFHRTRAQRAADRRKTTQYAGSRWLVLELDWWEWIGNRAHFLEALDTAILAQVGAGVAGCETLPAHVRADPTRVQSLSTGADPPKHGTIRPR